MNRTGLLIALAVAAAVGITFGAYPQLDLDLAALFYDPERLGAWLGNLRAVLWARWISTWLIAFVAAPAGIALIMKLLVPHRPMLIRGRAVLLPISAETRGHGTHSWPAIWQEHLAALLRATEPEPQASPSPSP